MLRVDAWLTDRLAPWCALAWPPRCVLCGQRGQGRDIDFCAPCEADLPFNEPACPRCAASLVAGAAASQECGGCLRRSLQVDSSVVPFRFAYPMDHMIRHLKYRRAVVFGRILGELFARTACARVAPQLLLPVPLAARRYRERGYNQAIVLAEHMGRSSGISLRTDLLVRSRETLEQAGLDQRARRKNIRHAFELVAPLPATHIAIVDDVVTTGSTVNEVARVLKRGGAKRVDVWAIARAGKHS